jgi:hypothetical protein
MTPPVQQLGAAVVISGRDALQDLAVCVLARIRQDRLNGASPARYGPLLATIHAAMSAIGHEVAEGVAPETQSNRQGADDWMSVTEAATELGVSDRHMRRLACTRQLGQRFGATWALDRGAVLALAEERKRKAHNGERQ